MAPFNVVGRVLQGVVGPKSTANLTDLIRAGNANIQRIRHPGAVVPGVVSRSVCSLPLYVPASEHLLCRRGGCNSAGSGFVPIAAYGKFLVSRRLAAHCRWSGRGTDSHQDRHSAYGMEQT